MDRKNETDWRRVAFSGYSMYPSLRPGDALVLVPIAASEAARGDIVCLPRGQDNVAHRVIDIQEDQNGRVLMTKGDNLTYADVPLPPHVDRLWKVAFIVRAGGRWKSPRFGRMLALLSTRNLSPGIIKGKAGRIVRSAYARIRPLLQKESSNP